MVVENVEEGEEGGMIVTGTKSQFDVLLPVKKEGCLIFPLPRGAVTCICAFFKWGFGVKAPGAGVCTDPDIHHG